MNNFGGYFWGSVKILTIFMFFYFKEIGIIFRFLRKFCQFFGGVLEITANFGVDHQSMYF